MAPKTKTKNQTKKAPQKQKAPKHNFKVAKPDYLNQKQFTLLELFIKYGDMTKAAIEAGYAKQSAAVTASRLVNSEKGKAYLDERFKKQNDALVADADEVMQYLTRVMRGEEKDQFDLEAPLSERTRAANELLKRNYDNNSNTEQKVQIIVDIPTAKELKEKVKKSARDKEKENTK